MKFLLKPPTRKMITALQRARAKELAEAGKNICTLEDYKSVLAGLYKRGFVNTKMVVVDSKEIVAVFITPDGIELLNRYEQDKNNKQLNSVS